MNSEKVKEIKECLEEFKDDRIGYYTNGIDRFMLTKEDILTLINELESENKSLQDLCNKTYEDLTKEIDRLESENESCHEVLADLKTIIKQQNDRIAELEKEIKENPSYAKGYAQGIKNTYEVVIPDKLKQFAERLKEKCEYNRKQYCCEATVSFNDIDETLKEFLSTTV